MVINVRRYDAGEQADAEPDELLFDEVGGRRAVVGECSRAREHHATDHDKNPYRGD
jgi:hypothetical protein